MNFTEKEKELAKQLKDAGFKWEPREGDWFWVTDDFAHQFYLGESLPSSFSFRAGEPYVFDSSMIWHIQQGGLKLDRFVWLPNWPQCREFLKNRGFSLRLKDLEGKIHIEADSHAAKFEQDGQTDLEAAYPLILKILVNGDSPH